jgi:hypothetical protein
MQGGMSMLWAIVLVSVSTHAPMRELSYKYSSESVCQTAASINADPGVTEAKCVPAADGKRILVTPQDRMAWDVARDVVSELVAD